MKSSRRLNIAIVGAGKVGSVLGRILQQGGEKIVCVVSRSIGSARKAGRFLHCNNVSTSLASIPPHTDLVFIATPHGAVTEVARQLSFVQHLSFKSLAVCHASGMHTADALEALHTKGATVFSFHPLQTFPRDFAPKDIVDSARGIYYGVDGNPRALRYARNLATKLEGKTTTVKPEMRAFYHAACVVASNHLTALLSVLEEMFLQLRTGEMNFYPIFEPIILATLQNVRSTSPARALSGPVARGGVETIADHFAAVKKFAPHILPYFSQLTEETVRLAEAKASINKEQAMALRGVIQSYS